ncbi:hypothetical protein LZ31DRAFT_560565 [Colletotrichum somersetense]|nr:hypothetical protein LZ31DRAFT_560565 [Colletotrichum somersetense]
MFPPPSTLTILALVYITHRIMDRYPCVNKFKYGIDCPVWVIVYGARCEDFVIVC